MYVVYLNLVRTDSFCVLWILKTSKELTRVWWEEPCLLVPQFGCTTIWMLAGTRHL